MTAHPRHPIPNVPPPSGRWVASRKAAVCEAIGSGEITAEDACERYRIEPDELAAWQERLRRYGHRGLEATRVQEVRGA